MTIAHTHMLTSSEENADEKSSSSFRMDVIWGYLSSLKLGNGNHKFGRISDVAKTVKKTVPKWRNAYIARAHGDILNLGCAKVARTFIARRNSVAWTFYRPSFETVFE